MRHRSPLISILMPVRNGAATVSRALESLCRQTYRNLEILVGDDGSTDETHRLVEDAARADPRVRPLLLPKTGMVNTLNDLLAEARGTWIARMDGDDLAHPRRLEIQWKLARETRADALGCRLRLFPSQGITANMKRWLAWQNSLLDHEAIRRERFVETTVSHATLLMRSALLTGAGGWRAFDGPEDFDLLLRLAARGARFAKAPEPLYFWRWHEAMSTRRDGRYRKEAFRSVAADHLVAGPLDGLDHVRVWGVGTSARGWADALRTRGVVTTLENVAVKALRDGRGQIPAERLPPRDGAFVLLVFGVPRVREALRLALARTGATEERDFLFVS